jgi:hypothetical protein
MNLTDEEIRELGKQIAGRARRIGITPARMRTFITVLVETRDSEEPHRRAVDGLTIDPTDEAFVRSLLGGNPVVQLLREGEG